MKKHISSLLCAVGLMLYAVFPAMAAETFYPISVEARTIAGFDQPCIEKVYQLSLSDDPSGIPTDDFEQNGYLYHLTDMTQSHDVGVDTQTKTETITQDSSTGELSEVLKQLPGQKEVKTPDGYSGTLLLDHTSVQVKAKGYETSTRNLSASRTYPNLSDADLSLVPKTVTDGGSTLTLSNVQWSSEAQADGSTHFTASATYAGTATSRYATGYTVTANYTGQVAKTGCEIVTYTALFAGTKIETVPEPAPEEPQPEVTLVQTPEPEPSAEKGPETTQEASPNSMRLFIVFAAIGCFGYIVVLAAAGYCFLRKKKKQEAVSQ